MGKKILLVEDSQEIGELLHANLTAHGYTVAWSQDGEKALALIGQFQPDLILSDVMLPGMSGLDLLAKVRQELRLTLPVVILTTKNQEFEIVKALNLGADDYLTKPFSVPELLARLKRHLVNPQ